MSAGAEDEDALALRRSGADSGSTVVRPKLNLMPPAADAQATDAGELGADEPAEEVPAGEHHHHHILIEPDEDRWRWRRKIRQNPRQLAVYRFAVGAAGLLLICTGLLTGPLPGPGGIPLILLGLAIWASEFEWAHKLMMRFKAGLHHYRQWSRRTKVLFWIAFLVCCGAFFYASLLIFGIPQWMPSSVEVPLTRLPGIN